jgi:hypothetical protein
MGGTCRNLAIVGAFSVETSRYNLHSMHGDGANSFSTYEQDIIGARLLPLVIKEWCNPA